MPPVKPNDIWPLSETNVYFSFSYFNYCVCVCVCVCEREIYIYRLLAFVVDGAAAVVAGSVRTEVDVAAAVVVVVVAAAGVVLFARALVFDRRLGTLF